MKVIRLMNEYLFNPIGVDFTKPTFLWNVKECKKQTAYQIIVYVNKIKKWDSGKVFSSSMRCTCPLTFNSRDYVEWEITAYDELDNPSNPAKAHFEIGLKDKEDWKALWVSGNYKVNKKKRYPVDYFKKEFEVKENIKARLYITSCGLYEAKINGVKAGNFVLAPGITNYKYRIQYQTIDVTDLLKIGKNIIEVELADGWYRGSCGAWGIRNQYGKETKFLAQLEIYNKKWEISTVFSDNTWSWSNDGPILFADNKDGEIIDLRKTPSYKFMSKISKYNITPTSSNNVLLEEHEHFKPKMIITPSKKKVLDFGQNIAGYISLKIKAKDGDKIYLRFGELIDKNGEFTQKNIQCASKKKDYRTPLQEIKIICKEGLNEYKTKFAIFGFQYVLIDTDLDFN